MAVILQYYLHQNSSNTQMAEISSKVDGDSSQSSNFSIPALNKIKRICQKHRRQNDYSKIGRWSQHEQTLYLQFIKLNRHKLETKESRRSVKIFKLMAIFIKSREADQCRSHHQKMQKKYHNLENIIKNCQNNLRQFQIKRIQINKNMLEIIQPIQEQIRFENNQDDTMLEINFGKEKDQEGLSRQTIFQYPQIDDLDLLQNSQEDPYKIIFLGA